MPQWYSNIGKNTEAVSQLHFLLEIIDCKVVLPGQMRSVKKKINKLIIMISFTFSFSLCFLCREEQPSCHMGGLSHWLFLQHQSLTVACASHCSEVTYLLTCSICRCNLKLEKLETDFSTLKKMHFKKSCAKDSLDTWNSLTLRKLVSVLFWQIDCILFYSFCSK